MADDKGTTQATDASAQGQAPVAQAKTDDWKPPTREEWERSQKELADTRKEAADRRHKAKEAEERAAAEAKAKAEKDGEWSKVLDAERGEKKKLADEIAALGPKATRAEKLEVILKNEVESLEKQVGAEKAAAVAHLAPEDRLPILKQFAAMAAGPGAAKASTNAPPAGHTVAVDVSKMSGAELDAHFAGKSPEQIKAELGLKKTGGWFSR